MEEDFCIRNETESLCFGPQDLEADYAQQDVYDGVFDQVDQIPTPQNIHRKRPHNPPGVDYPPGVDHKSRELLQAYRFARGQLDKQVALNFYLTKQLEREQRRKMLLLYAFLAAAVASVYIVSKTASNLLLWLHKESK